MTQSSNTMNATAVIPLTDRNVEFLRKIQFNAEIPESAKYIAFLEDGYACFLNEELTGAGPLGLPPFPSFNMVTMHENILIEL